MPNRVENDAHDLALATPAKRDKAGVAGGARQRSSRTTSGLERRPRACGCKAAWRARAPGMQCLGPALATPAKILALAMQVLASWVNPIFRNQLFPISILV